MESFTIRDYKEDDFAGVMAIWASTGMGGYERGDDNDTILKSLDIGGRLLLLVDVNSGEIAGTSWMTFDGRRIHMHHFGIAPYYQGRGLAHMLLRASLEHVKEQGHQVKLEVHETNHKAVSLYKGAGFSYLGDYDVYIIRDTDTIDNYLDRGNIPPA